MMPKSFFCIALYTLFSLNVSQKLKKITQYNSKYSVPTRTVVKVVKAKDNVILERPSKNCYRKINHGREKDVSQTHKHRGRDEGTGGHVFRSFRQ